MKNLVFYFSLLTFIVSAGIAFSEENFEESQTNSIIANNAFIEVLSYDPCYPIGIEPEMAVINEDNNVLDTAKTDTDTNVKDSNTDNSEYVQQDVNVAGKLADTFDTVEKNTNLSAITSTGIVGVAVKAVNITSGALGWIFRKLSKASDSDSPVEQNEGKTKDDSQDNNAAVP